MQILRDRDVAFTPDVTVYRETSWASLVMGIVLLSVVAGAGYYIFIVSGVSSLWAAIAFLVWAAIMALPTYLGFRTFRASLRPESWRFAWAQDRLYLRFRSFQNYTFDPDTPSAVCIPRRKIAWIRGHKQRLEVQDSDGDWNGVVSVRGLQIKLRDGTDRASLSDALSAEASRRSPSKSRFNHYPVTLDADGIVQVEMRHPEAVVKQLAPFYQTTPNHEVPLTRFDDMTAAEKETHILDLVRAGRKIDAIKAAREVHGYDIAAAMRLVDDLAAK